MEFSLPSNEQISSDILTRLQSLPNINIYRSLANLPTIFNPWIDMVQGIYALDINVRWREVAILRQAFHAQASYELHQHHLVAFANGLSESEIKTITNKGKIEQLDEHCNMICQVVDELAAHTTLSQNTRQEFIKLFGAHLAQEIIAVISFYSAVGIYLNAMNVDIEVDNPLAGQANPAAHSIR